MKLPRHTSTSPPTMENGMTRRSTALAGPTNSWRTGRRRLWLTGTGSSSNKSRSKIIKNCENSVAVTSGKRLAHHVRLNTHRIPHHIQRPLLRLRQDAADIFTEHAQGDQLDAAQEQHRHHDRRVAGN